jgi:hypothetical protein
MNTENLEFHPLRTAVGTRKHSPDHTSEIFAEDNQTLVYRKEERSSDDSPHLCWQARKAELAWNSAAGVGFCWEEKAFGDEAPHARGATPPTSIPSSWENERRSDWDLDRCNGPRHAHQSWQARESDNCHQFFDPYDYVGVSQYSSDMGHMWDRSPDVGPPCRLSTSSHRGGASKYRTFGKQQDLWCPRSIASPNDVSSEGPYHEAPTYLGNGFAQQEESTDYPISPPFPPQPNNELSPRSKTILISPGFEVVLRDADEVRTPICQ